MISILNYGMGNLGSIRNMFRRIGVDSQIIDRPEDLRRASKVVLPGVGKFDEAMLRINDEGFLSVLNEKALVERVPILGICLGMQLLTRSSEEGILPGLGWIPAETKRFDRIEGFKVPHMGWNTVQVSRKSPLTDDLPLDARFYFVHSYKVRVDNENHSILKCKYDDFFDAAVQNDNIFGVQFHPEKSHKYGMQILENFANY